MSQRQLANMISMVVVGSIFHPPEGKDYKWYISGIIFLPIGGWTMPPIPPPFRGTRRPTIDDKSGQIITTSAEVTLNGGLIRELPQNPLNSGLGIILICPDKFVIPVLAETLGKMDPICVVQWVGLTTN